MTAVQERLDFDAPKAPLPVRSTDPETARAAARRINLRARKRQVMEAIGFLLYGAEGSFTADEVLDVLRLRDARWERGWVASRLSQLASDELVSPSGVAEGRMGADVMTFRITAEGRKWLAEQS